MSAVSAMRALVTETMRSDVSPSIKKTEIQLTDGNQQVNGISLSPSLSTKWKEENIHPSAMTRMVDRLFYLRSLSLFCFLTVILKISQMNTAGSNVFAFVYILVIDIVYTVIAWMANWWWNDDVSKQLIRLYFYYSFFSPIFLLYVPWFSIFGADQRSAALIQVLGELLSEVYFIAVRTISTSVNAHYTMYGNKTILPLRDFTSLIYIVICFTLFGYATQIFTLAQQLNNYYAINPTYYYLSIPLLIALVGKKHLDNLYANRRSQPSMTYYLVFNSVIVGICGYYLFQAGYQFEIFGWISQNFVTFIYQLDDLCDKFPPGTVPGDCETDTTSYTFDDWLDWMQRIITGKEHITQIFSFHTNETTAK